MARKRATILISLLAAGAAAGAAGALMAKRRNRARWQEFEARGADSLRTGAAEPAGQATSSWTDPARETVREKTDTTTSSRDSAEIFAEQSAHSMSRNTRS